MPKRATEHFTKDTASKAEVKAKRYQIRDAKLPGFMLRVMPTGTKTYLIALDRNTIRKVGDANQLTLETAYTKAKKLMGRHASGEKIKSSRSQCPTLKKFLTGKYRDYAEKQNRTGAADVARLLASCEPLLKTRLDKLTGFQIEKWKAGRLSDVAPSTVKRDLATLSAALNLATHWGIIDSNPVGTGKSAVKVKVPQHHRVRYLTDDERKRLLNALDERDRKKRKARQSGNVFRIERNRKPLPEIEGYSDYLTPLVLLVMNTGLRRGEALSLTWNKVNLSQNPQLEVTAHYAKTNKTRYIPLNTTAVSVLTRWKQQGKGTGLVFPNPVTGERMTKLKTSWPSLIKKAKIQDFRFHDLRHDFASRLVMAGTDLYRVKELLGHGSIQMTEKYAHLSPKALADAVESIA